MSAPALSGTSPVIISHLNPDHTSTAFTTATSASSSACRYQNPVRDREPLKQTFRTRM